VITDDEVPLKELLEGIAEAYSKHKTLLSQAASYKYDMSRRPFFIQVRQEDFLRITAKFQQGLHKAASDEDSLDFRAKLLTDLDRRVHAAEGAEFDPSNDKIIEQVKFVRKVADDITLADFIALMLAEQEDSMPEKVKECVTQIRDGVEFVAPVSEEQVNEVKAKLASGLAGMFKKKTEEDPDFAKVLLESDESTQNHFKDIFRDPLHDCEKYGHYEFTNDPDVEREMMVRGFEGESMFEKLNRVFVGFKVLNEAICRSSLITILSQMAD